jgi:hypothetical protein
MSLAEVIPNETLEIVFDYLENTSLSKSFLCKRRESKLNDTLRKYMKSFMPTTVYSTNSIKYFRQLYDKDEGSGSLVRISERRRRATRITYRFHFASRQKVSAQQCCAKTRSGRRCRKKTFMLFCECHKDAKPYWM